MNEFDDLFLAYPALRKTDPTLLRRALDDRLLFDRLVAEGDTKLTPEERMRHDQVHERIRAAAQAHFAARKVTPSWLATKTGWRRYLPDRLRELTAAAASVGVLATEVLARVLVTTTEVVASVLRGGSLGVDRVDPETGARAPCDDCARRITAPPTFTSGPDGTHFTCTVEFEFFEEPELAASFAGGAGILEFTDSARTGGPSFVTRLVTEGTIVRAAFHAPAPFAAPTPPGGQIGVMRLALVPPGSIARAVLAL